jgi:hypothetical protein
LHAKNADPYGPYGNETIILPKTDVMAFSFMIFGTLKITVTFSKNLVPHKLFLDQVFKI